MKDYFFCYIHEYMAKKENNVFMKDYSFAIFTVTIIKLIIQNS